MRHLRIRYLGVMGLVACTPKETPVTVEPTTATASASASASASATATASVTAAAPAPDAGAFTPRGGSWEIQFPNKGGALGSNNPKYCPNAPARCYLQSELGGACPASISVACGCHPGGACMNANAPCAAPQNKALGTQETAKKGKAACCYELPFYCVLPWEGRAFEALTSETTRSDWIVETTGHGEGEWSRMASAEHASIASFARASLELLALGAPADLVRDTHLAALDEIEHARFAYAMASRGGETLGPAPLPEAGLPMRMLGIETFAVATFVEACGPETAGAEDMQRRAEESSGEVRDALLRIAEDERRHADLAWRTLAWAVSLGGDNAREALRRAIERVQTDDDTVREVVIPCAIELARRSRSTHLE